MYAFEMNSSNRSILVCLNGNVKSDNRRWSEVKSIVDKVHRHVCGHKKLHRYEAIPRSQWFVVGNCRGLCVLPD